MGTEVRVLVAAGHDASPVEALFREWDRTLTRFDPSSELCRVNASAGDWTPASELLVAAVEAALAAARDTEGVFDPTLLPQLEAAGYDGDFDALPAERARIAGRPVGPGGGWRAVEVDTAGRRVRLPAGGALDLGGIAKGMAVDAAGALLAEAGVPWFGIDAGGDLRVWGRPPGLESWPVLVETGGLPAGLSGGALATSSTTGRRWRVAGVEQHHLIDPATGRPSTSGVVSATVAAGTCAEAEVAVKAALLLGLAVGAAWLDRRQLSGVLALGDGSLARVRWPELGGAA
jgi:thiamine biosynthesis lipoprotein